MAERVAVVLAFAVVVVLFAAAAFGCFVAVVSWVQSWLL
jgi:hypothetical protein